MVADRKITLKQTLYVPDLRTNLLSVAKIVDNGHDILIKRDAAFIRNETEEVVAVAERRGDLFFMQGSAESATIAFANPNSSLAKWHERLGHVNEKNLREMAVNDVILRLKLNPNEKLEICEVSVKGKQAQTPFNKSEPERTSALLEIVHTDICGPMRVASKGGARYFAVFVDDKSRWCEVHFPQKKSDVFEAFKKYKAMAETATGKKIKALQSDNGTEFCNKNFDSLLDECGIKRRLMVPHTPQ
jgi:transposase InsO family protein